MREYAEPEDEKINQCFGSGFRDPGVKKKSQNVKLPVSQHNFTF